MTKKQQISESLSVSFVSAYMHEKEEKLRIQTIYARYFH